jgi:signal recognition particle subunit SRP54
MLDILTDGFKKASLALSGRTKLSESSIDPILEDVRTSLLEADVEFGVAKNFLSRVREKALGLEVQVKAGRGHNRTRVSAGDHFVKICKEELEELMGPGDGTLNLPSNRPARIMMVGLQGTGKTTTTAKLALYLKEQKKKKPLLVAADMYRPAAVEQLKILGKRIDVPVFYKDSGADPVDICDESLQYAIEHKCDVVIFDTAGRLSVDEKLMGELKNIKQKTNPDNTLLVCDSMMGQDAVTTAAAFDSLLDLSGFVMTKLDGDARGGAALSIKEITGKPIKFLGMGEALERFEEFRPEGLASRILGMGDIVGLMDDFEKVTDDDAQKDAERMMQGSFNFKDFYKQISTIQKMGSIKDVMAKLPMQNMIPEGAQVDEAQLGKIKVMINSMCEKERLNPSLIDISRAQRIAKGSGKSIKDVNELLKKFKQMRTMMGKMNKNLGGLMGRIPGLGKLGGQMPSMGDLAQMMQGKNRSSEPKFRPIDRDKLKRLRKSARQNKKRNRKR